MTDLKAKARDVEQCLCAAERGEPVQDDVDVIYFALVDADHAAELRGLQWALDAFMGGGYDELAFNECEEAVEKRIAELKAVSV